MRSDAKRAFYFSSDASSLGGTVVQPFQKIVPAQASVALPVAGGHMTTRSAAFNFEEIISCTAAYTRVSGREIQTNGPWSTVVTSVVEGLNILDIVTADRLVAQMSVEFSSDSVYPRISLAGSYFDRLRLGGCEANPKVNSNLLIPSCGRDSSQARLTFPDFLRVGRDQVDAILKSGKGDDSGEGGDKQKPPDWITERYGWMTADRDTGEDGLVLCSLIDGVDRAIPGCSFGNVVEIPDFGRIFLGELLVTPQSIRISMVRADLGCNVSASVSASSGGVGGHMVPP
jgi:hypothetical protein